MVTPSLRFEGKCLLQAQLCLRRVNVLDARDGGCPLHILSLQLTNSDPKTTFTFQVLPAMKYWTHSLQVPLKPRYLASAIRFYGCIYPLDFLSAMGFGKFCRGTSAQMAARATSSHHGKTTPRLSSGSKVDA